MKKHNLIISIIAGVGLFLSHTSVFAEVVIIGHAKSTGSLDAKTAKKLYLGKTKHITGMSAVTVVGQSDKSPIKAEFTKKVTNKNLVKYKAYWSKMIFSGKAVPPLELGNDNEVRSYVASHADAVGYVDAASVDSSVKVLLRLP